MGFAVDFYHVVLGEFTGLQKTTATTPNKQLRLLGCQGSDRAYLWLFNPQAAWWNIVVEKHQPKQIKGTTISVQGIQTGTYTVEWWHTYEPKVIENKRLSLKQGALRISVPPFSGDIACKIRMTK